MNAIKKISILLTLFVFVVFSSINFVYAQENSSETDEIINDSKTSTASESIKEIRKIIVDNIENKKVQGAIDNRLNRKISTIGQITRITDDAITIKNISGTKILSLDNNPKITKLGKEINVDTIEVENWAMVLGKLEDDNFTPHFIFIFSKTLRPKNQSVMIGTITSISKSELNIIPRSGDKEITLKISTNTNYQDFDGEEAKVGDFSTDINVLTSGFEDDNGITISTLRSLAPLD
jgi:hypothetical protein